MSPEAIAREMRSAQDAATQIAPFTSRLAGFDLPAAYEVARLIHEERVLAGAVPVGRKIGFTNPGIWEEYGVRQPVWAHVYEATVVVPFKAGTQVRIGVFTEPKIEPEIVLHFRSAPPLTGEIAAILDCIDWVAHGFEIVQSHFPGWNFQAADTVADAALHGALLVGEPQDTGKLGADLAGKLERFTIALSCNGALRERGQGANVLGSPLAALAHLIAVLATQPLAAPIRAGELVTTGTLTRALPIRGGETWSTAIDGIALPGMRVEFEA